MAKMPRTTGETAPSRASSVLRRDIAAILWSLRSRGRVRAGRDLERGAVGADMPQRRGEVRQEDAGLQAPGDGHRPTVDGDVRLLLEPAQAQGPERTRNPSVDDDVAALVDEVRPRAGVGPRPIHARGHECERRDDP